MKNLFGNYRKSNGCGETKSCLQALSILFKRQKCIQNTYHIVYRLLRSLCERVPKPFRARFKGLSSVFRRASEQAPSTIPSERVYGHFFVK